MLPFIANSLRYSVRQSTEQGMTIAETLTAIIAAGILTSMATISMVGMYNRNLVNQGFVELRGILREAQANATRKSLRCTVTINTTASPVTIRAVDSQGASCAPNRTLSSGVSVAVSSSGGAAQNTVNFSYVGNTPSSTTAVVYWGNQPDLQKKCLAISEGIGLFVEGNYTASPSSSISSSSCQVSS